MGLGTFQGFKRLSNDCFVQLNDDDFHRLQRAVVSIGFDVMDFCDSHNIEYMLIGGSCIGAVRHQGIIPWDDDVDLGMTRRDFERFRTLFPGDMSDKYNLQTPEDTAGHCTFLSQVRVKGTTLRGRDDFVGEFGIPVDIFIIENTYDNVVARNLHGFACMALGYLQSARKFAEYPDHYRRLTRGNEEMTRATKIKIRIGSLLKFASLASWSSLTNKVFKMCKNDNSKYVTLPADTKHFFGELQPREVFVPVSYATFEGRKVKIPHDYHAYLTKAQGADYMTPPAEAERERHLALELDFGTFKA